MRHCKSIAGTSMFLLGGLLMSVVPACASIVATYTTTGVFSASGTATVTGTSAGTTLKFGSGSGNLVIPPVSTGTMGTFTTTVPKGQSITGSGTFTLTIDQTSPSVGTGGFGSGAFTGKLSTNAIIGSHSGGLVITFAQTSITIGGVVYTLEGLGGANLAADQLGLGVGTTTLQADVTTPEPTFYSLVGIGLAALAMAGMKFRRTGTR